MRSIVDRLALASLLVGFTQCGTPAADADPLAWTIGSWHGIRRSGADGSEAPMTVRVEALAEGDGQVECLRVDGKTDPYVGFAIRRRDRSGDWSMVYVNSTQRAFARLEGEVGSARSVWRSVTPGRTRESRLISEHPTMDAWRKTQEISDDGATWRVLFTDELERLEPESKS